MALLALPPQVCQITWQTKLQRQHKCTTWPCRDYSPSQGSVLLSNVKNKLNASVWKWQLQPGEALRLTGHWRSVLWALPSSSRCLERKLNVIPGSFVQKGGKFLGSWKIPCSGINPVRAFRTQRRRRYVIPLTLRLLSQEMNNFTQYISDTRALCSMQLCCNLTSSPAVFVAVVCVLCEVHFLDFGESLQSNKPKGVRY